ncbi:phosphoserine phosphatase SerB [Segnochrobactrum spirostomi]|uniref:Phosphoserine phosphatase n=1 Tax=Segnochrobactrum spirostomi TaxID=2608987 RepID=A0A6A7XY69_9HYPH|nr:phosphoserine phosphatase SerB [Segnochrobactrum spirostomi]MQT11298.1 phosphoserine phosphatase SerB [Segnochrobactrum spirostomi]
MSHPSAVPPVPLVATLVADPALRGLEPALIERAAAAIGGAEIDVLAPGTAADLLYEKPRDAARADEAAIRDALGGAPIDVFVQPRAGRRKRLLIADMDSTLIGQECIDELAAELGLKDRIAAITERAMRGEIAFEPALRERVGLLAGLDAGVTEKVWRERISLNAGGHTLVATMRAHGAYTAVVSGGFTVFTTKVAAALGFDEHNANILEIADGRLAGTVSEPILGREAKLKRLEDLIAEKGLVASETLAVGDGANDLAMIRHAGLGVAYRAKPAVAAEADARVDHADLTALLYFQGYRAADFHG